LIFGSGKRSLTSEGTDDGIEIKIGVKVVFDKNTLRRQQIFGSIIACAVPKSMKSKKLIKVQM